MKCLIGFSLVAVYAGLLVMCGCSGNSSSSTTPPFIYAVLESFPTVSNPLNMKNALVTVRDGDSNNAITDALVTINSVSLSYNSTYQNYQGNISVALGGSLTLSVTAGGKSYTVMGNQFTSLPAISAPLSSATISVGNQNTISWSGGAPTTNALYLCGVLAGSDPTGQVIWPSTGHLQQVPINTTTLNIPANSLTPGARLVIVGIATVQPIPEAAAGSAFAIGGYNAIPISINN